MASQQEPRSVIFGQNLPLERSSKGNKERRFVLFEKGENGGEFGTAVERALADRQRG